MKRYFMNPFDFIFSQIFWYPCIIIALLGLFGGVKEIVDGTEWWIVIILQLLSFIINIPGAICFAKYRGRFFVDGKKLTMTKGKKSFVVEIENIKSIEIRRLYITWSSKSTRKCYQFLIYLKGEKRPLDFLITNKNMFYIAEKYDIKIGPSNILEEWRTSNEKPTNNKSH